jgi:hypothetical protein
MMGPVPVSPVLSSLASSSPAPSLPVPLPSATQSQMPSTLALLQASPPGSPSLDIPPLMPILQAPDLSDNEAEVEHTIIPWCISVPTVSSSNSAQPHHFGYTTHPLGYYRQLAGEDDDAEYVNYVYSADYDNIIAEAISDTNSNPKLLSEAQSHDDWP